MMQPMDPLSQLAMCCGLGGRRRGYKEPRNPYLYSPSTAHFDPGTGWPIGNHYGPQPQPYILLTQPVIIAGNPATTQTNTMTLVQHAHSATNPFPGFSLIGNAQQTLQPTLVSSQYAIYSSPSPIAVTNNLTNSSMPTNGITQEQATSQLQARVINQNQYLTSRSQALALMGTNSLRQTTNETNRTVNLSSEIFRKIELVEKQVDLTKDIELIEKHDIVITRALNPYSLMPYLTEATLKKYHEHFLFSEQHIIRFIEIIKRPGQTLGLYIRTVQFEDPQSSRSRPGLVITKIDSDSPIYSSQVLHVGDEILSVNLVDVQGMSLDDVVIIISIPKRLVLAIRIPKERDQLLSMNLLQQQQLLEQQQQQQQFGSRFLNSRSIALSMNNDQPLRPKLAYPMHVESGATFQGSNQANDAMRRDKSLRDEREFQITRPIRVQSASYMREGGPKSIPVDGFDLQEPRPASSIDQWVSESFENLNLDSRLMTTGGSQQANQAFIGSYNPPRQIETVETELQRKGFDDTEADLQLERVSRGSKVGRPLSNQCSYPNEVASHLIPGTFPRRTLPTRPSAEASQATSIKQPVICNLRLADTPEQSSYFSSSIDAINRELKELRRQRMALSNEESAQSESIDY